MKVLEEVRLRIHTELPHCKTHADVSKLFDDCQSELMNSKAPFGLRQEMWSEIKNRLSALSRRPEVINDAHAIIDKLLKSSLMSELNAN